MEIVSGKVVLCKFYFSDFKQNKNRPVLVLKDNLPFDDFVAIPISSQISNMHEDEHLIENEDFFEGAIPKPSKIILRKTFVVSKKAVLKHYGVLKQESLTKFKVLFCKYFECSGE